MSEEERRNEASSPATTASSSSSSNSVYIRSKKARITNMSDGAEEDVRRNRSSNWDTNMDRVLVDLMLEEMQKKNYCNGNFKPTSWTTIARSFNASFRTNLTSAQVKECFKSLKKKFSLIEEVLQLSGWGWDSESCTPRPGYEGAWDELVKVNSKYGPIKRKSFPLYEDMQILCKNSMATGELADGIPRTTNKPIASERSPGSQAQINIEDDDDFLDKCTTLGDPDYGMMSVSMGQQKETNGTDGSPMPQNTAISSGELAGTSKLKRKGTENGKLKGKAKCGPSALDSFVEATRERNAILKDLFDKDFGRSSSEAHPSLEGIPSLHSVLRDVKSMPTVPYRVYLKSMKLFTDPQMRFLFVTMPEEDKENWLLMMTSEE